MWSELYASLVLATDNAVKNKAITANVAKYILSRIHATLLGTLRLRHKLHKVPMGSRPIFNFRCSSLSP